MPDAPDTLAGSRVQLVVRLEYRAFAQDLASVWHVSVLPSVGDAVALWPDAETTVERRCLTRAGWRLELSPVGVATPEEARAACAAAAAAGWARMAAVPPPASPVRGDEG